MGPKGSTGGNPRDSGSRQSYGKVVREGEEVATWIEVRNSGQVPILEVSDDSVAGATE